MQVEKDVDYMVKEKLSHGGQGAIFMASTQGSKLHEKSKHTPIVAKVMFKDGKKPESQRRLFHQEVALMYQLGKFPYFGELIGYDDQNLTLLMKYYPEGSLLSFLKHKNAPISTKMIVGFISDIAHGIEIMHKNYLAHCDLKSDNVLVEFDPRQNRFRAFLTDFGITRILKKEEDLEIKHFKTVKIIAASIQYSAPEVIRYLRGQERGGSANPEFFTSSDIYALGCVICDLLSRKRVWSDHTH